MSLGPHLLHSSSPTRGTELLAPNLTLLEPLTPRLRRIELPPGPVIPVDSAELGPLLDPVTPTDSAFCTLGSLPGIPNRWVQRGQVARVRFFFRRQLGHWQGAQRLG
jgi:hypothetical protein